jgi:hypothetical protein
MLAVMPFYPPSPASAQKTHYLPLQLGAPIVGKPFSATRTLDYEPANPSPDPLAIHAEEKIFRDSAGRTRSEIKYPGQLSTLGIIDCVAHAHYHWTAGDSVAIRGQISEVAPVTKASEKLSADAPIVEGVPTRHSRSATGKDKAECVAPSLIDADDKALGSAAIDAAKHTAYMPLEIDGHQSAVRDHHLDESLVDSRSSHDPSHEPEIPRTGLTPIRFRHSKTD